MPWVSRPWTNLSIIDAIDSERRLLEFFALAEYSGVTSPLEIYVMPDFLEPERYRLYLFQSGLGLPNSDYYTDDSEQGRAIVAAYHSYMRDVYMALGYSRDAADKATSSSWALELGLAAHHRPPEKTGTIHFGITCTDPGTKSAIRRELG